MKNKSIITAVLFSIWSFTSVLSQQGSIALTFTADSICRHIPLSGILVENLTRGCDTTLYAPDTVLNLDILTGIEESNKDNGCNFTLSQNIPNPFKDKTTIKLYIPEDDQVLVSVNDITGQNLIRENLNLKRGYHFIDFYAGNAKIHFLTVAYKNQFQTIKMFRIPDDSYERKICEIEHKQYLSNTLKHGKNVKTGDFFFMFGDKLKITAFANIGGYRVTNDSPSGDQTYRFHFNGIPCWDMPTITDADGNTYNTVQIGDQCWMKENLMTTTYSNSIPIPNITDNNEWTTLSYGAYAWNNNDINMKNIYGALYNWYAVNDPNGLCPAGWHVPSHEEWTILTNYIGGMSPPHGNELKSCRQVNTNFCEGCNTTIHPRWNEYSTEYGTDNYGFSGYPGSLRHDWSGTFNTPGMHGRYWSSTEDGASWAKGRGLTSWDGGIIYTSYHKGTGFSVRCVRD